MKIISILGSTGSIGTQTIEVIQRMDGEFQIKYLSAHNNVDLLIEQSKLLNPTAVCIGDESKVEALKATLNDVEILSGRDGLLELASRDDVDLIVNGLVGASGMEPTVNAIKSGVDVALSNKESLVMAGDHINTLLLENDVNLYPVDSEHSAIWQCLAGEQMDQVKRLILTGSGGPFRTMPTSEFSNITKAQALKHPNWSMGNKITIDSATMMNKGLEVIEARWLFNMGADDIDIVVHPQSIIHSMVEFNDGSVKAQLGVPDMKIPIQYAITYPNHVNVHWETMDLAKIGTLTFEEPDVEKFRCIQLAYDALRAGGSHPVVLNVANDTAVYAFLDDQINFVDIPTLIESALAAHPIAEHPDLGDIQELTTWTQQFVKGKINS
jgi:1-deoxy-D-xylulose-5-phosphate reductoisomerase